MRGREEGGGIGACRRWRPAKGEREAAGIVWSCYCSRVRQEEGVVAVTAVASSGEKKEEGSGATVAGSGEGREKKSGGLTGEKRGRGIRRRFAGVAASGEERE
ncbi:hypothetical protein HAX54_049886, partial [Datura stramonium]|nr:hypothetical protein [Datura stramonium]